MPIRYRRRIRRRRRKRPRYRRKRRSRRRPWGSKISYLKLNRKSGFPDQFYTKLKYRELLDFSDSISSSITQTFSLNGLFQPNLGSSGHQPLGYDEFSFIYNKYEVMGSKILLTLLPGSGTGNTNRAKLVLYGDGNLTPVANIETAQEQPYSRTRYITGGQLGMLHKMGMYLGVKKLEGRNIASINFTGSTGNPGSGGTNPAKNKYWHMLLNTLTTGDNVNNFIDVQIIYYCKFFEPKALLGS